MSGLYNVVLGVGAAERGAPGLLRRVRHKDAAFTIDAPDEIGLVLTLSESHRVERRMNGRTANEPPRIGRITLMPPGYPARFSVTGPARVLMLRLPWPAMADWLAEDHDADPDRIEIQPRFHDDDPMLARLLYRAAAEQDGGEEAVARSVAARLLTNHAAGKAHVTHAPRRGGLAPARLRRVLDRIEAGLQHPLSLGVLSAEAGMSPFHFAREFQGATGVSPHQYVIRRRVERAVCLLSRRELEISQVAHGAGFAHASHLARHMCRHVGLTPEVFRNRVLP